MPSGSKGTGWQTVYSLHISEKLLVMSEVFCFSVLGPELPLLLASHTLISCFTLKITDALK